MGTINTETLLGSPELSLKNKREDKRGTIEPTREGSMVSLQHAVKFEQVGLRHPDPRSPKDSSCQSLHNSELLGLQEDSGCHHPSLDGWENGGQGVSPQGHRTSLLSQLTVIQCVELRRMTRGPCGMLAQGLSIQAFTASQFPLSLLSGKNMCRRGQRGSEARPAGTLSSQSERAQGSGS